MAGLHTGRFAGKTVGTEPGRAIAQEQRGALPRRALSGQQTGEIPRPDHGG